MRKNLRITVDGRSYDVVVEEIDQAAVPAEPHPAAAPALPVTPIAVPASPAAALTADAGAITAPLGGMVISIDVAVGRDVAVGEKVATIEAMKMMTDVMSKIAGKVTHIAAHANDSVETGQVLMTLG